MFFGRFLPFQAKKDELRPRPSTYQVKTENLTSTTKAVAVGRITERPSKIKNGEKRRPLRTRVSTEQIVPSPKISQVSLQHNSSTLPNLKKNIVNEDMELRVILLAPPPGKEAMPYERSKIDAYSRFGSVSIEIIRLPGAANHHFRLDATSNEDIVRVTLPSKFRGNIYVNRHSTRSLPIRVDYGTELQKYIDAGAVRLNSPVLPKDDEDEVHIYNAKTVKLELEVEQVQSRETSPWILESRFSRTFRRFFGTQ